MASVQDRYQNRNLVSTVAQHPKSLEWCIKCKSNKKLIKKTCCYLTKKAYNHLYDEAFCKETFIQNCQVFASVFKSLNYSYKLAYLSILMQKVLGENVRALPVMTNIQVTLMQSRKLLNDTISDLYLFVLFLQLSTHCSLRMSIKSQV